MKRKISALLLTILLAMTIVCDAFAWTHTLSGTGITPPARFSSVEETKDGLECKFKDARSREGLIYMPAGKLPETAFKKEISRLLKSFEQEGYEIVQGLKKVGCGDGRKAWYIFFSGYDKSYVYGYIAFVPCRGGEYVAVIDMLGTAKEAHAFPFSKKDVRRIAATIEG